MTYISNIARAKGDPRVLRSGPRSAGAPDELTRALGWFSIGLGLAELLAPHRITRALGMEGQETLLRLYGARELGAGMMTLSTEKEIGMWSRVAGDALDVATLVPALRSDNPKRGNAAIALAMVLGITALDCFGAKALAARHARPRGSRRTYRDRSGFPQGVEKARGAARDFKAPRDMRATPTLAFSAPQKSAG